MQIAMLPQRLVRQGLRAPVPAPRRKPAKRRRLRRELLVEMDHRVAISLKGYGAKVRHN
jgi:hypothetical protein